MSRLRNAYLTTCAAAVACSLVPGTNAARADKLRIENVTVAPRDASTATVKFDIAWENSWRHGDFHDAAWVFFKVQADSKTGWQPVRLAADKVLNPAGYGQEKGATSLEFIVPPGDDGLVGMFVRRAADGKGAVAARHVAAVWDFTANKGITKDTKASVGAFAVEMVYVPEGPFYLGSGGEDLNRFYMFSNPGLDPEETDEIPPTPAYRVKGSGAIPTGRQTGKLWAAGLVPEDGGQLPASFPNGHAAFYCMKKPSITRGQYAGFLSTLAATEANARFHMGGHGRWIGRSGESPDYTYSASNPDSPCPWLSWADCAAFTAWAGLRPMTELEYEKAIRGPQNPVPNDAGLSYWGIMGIGIPTLCERPVSAGSAAGRTFTGTHGRGTPALPADWPADVGGAVFRGGLPDHRYLGTSGRTDARYADADRSLQPFAGWRGARTAPAEAATAGNVAASFDCRIVRPVARLGRGVSADGVLDEWDKPLAALGGPADIFPVDCRFAPLDFYNRLLKPWQGPEDMGAKVYLGCDGEALCVAAEVTDDRHANTKTGDGIWSGDALQLGLVTTRDVHWKVALALTKAGVALHQWEGEGDALAKAADCAVARDDEARVTRYELRLPLTTLGLKPGADFGLNIMFFDDDDGNGHRYWLQLAPGMAPGPAGGGNNALYPRFVLNK